MHQQRRDQPLFAVVFKTVSPLTVALEFTVHGGSADLSFAVVADSPALRPLVGAPPRQSLELPGRPSMWLLPEV